MNLSYLDLFICLPLVWGGYRGFKKGLILELASLIALFLGTYGAFKFSDLTANYLGQYVSVEPKWLGLLSFILTFIAIILLVHLLAKMLDKMLKAVALGFVNRLLGLVFGLLKYALVISLILLLFAFVNDRFELVENTVFEKSLLYGPFNAFSSLLFPKIVSFFDSL